MATGNFIQGQGIHSVVDLGKGFDRLGRTHPEESPIMHAMLIICVIMLRQKEKTSSMYIM